jgi:hypothetical protein
MKCEVKLYWEFPKKKLWVRYWIDKSEEWFILDLSEEVIEQIKTSTIEEVHNILNKELYKQSWICLWSPDNLKLKW